MRRTPWRLLAALLLSLAAACGGDLPTENETGETAKLGFALNLSATDVVALAVQVTASDIPYPLVFNIPVTNGTANGHIDVPPGLARTITVRTYDASHAQTHEGSTTVDVKPGQNPPVTVTLVPRAGALPISVNFGSVVIQVIQRSSPTLPYGYAIGTMAYFEAIVTAADGSPIPGATVRWASTDPSVMDMRQDGTGMALAQGTADIVATWNGYGASFRVNVAGSGPDYATPTLNAVSFDQSVVRYTGTNRTVMLNVYATDDVSGVARVQADIRATDGSGAGWMCSASPAGAGLWQCPVTIDAFVRLGEYEVKYVSLEDNAGWGVGMSTQNTGFAAKFSVVP